MTKQTIVWQQKKTDCYSSYYKLNNNMELHSDIYKVDDHYELSIDFICSSVKLDAMQEFLKRNKVVTEVIGLTHPDYSLRGECLFYKEPIASIRDGKVCFELWKDNMIVLLKL